MGWDYWTYMNQPQFFLEELALFLTQEAEKNNSDIRNINAKMKSAPKGGGLTRKHG